MREILFRGKRIDNGEWVEGYLYEHEPPLAGIVSENDVPEPSKWFVARTGFADWNMPRPVEFVEVDPSTVGQYTGLPDKYSEWIFEGDIVKQTFEKAIREPFEYDLYGEDVGPVVILPSKGVCIKNPISLRKTDGEVDISGKKLKMYKEVCSGRCEIIGNIFDNPELLLESKEECNT